MPAERVHPRGTETGETVGLPVPGNASGPPRSEELVGDLSSREGYAKSMDAVDISHRFAAYM
jgi:hypothetical protein